MSFSEELKSGKLLILDGAMGTQLEKQGIGPDVLVRANIDHPDKVVKVHQNYCQAGCDAVLTNTLLHNEGFLSLSGNESSATRLNAEGVRLAREGTDNQFVLGDVGLLGHDLLQPCGRVSEEEATEIFKRQIVALVNSGIDGMMIETHIHLQEALCALRACKSTTDVPTIVSMAFKNDIDGGRTDFGDRTEDIVTKLEDEGADAIGINCGTIKIDRIANIVRNMRARTDLPISVKPNAGEPYPDDMATAYKMPMDDFLREIQRCVDEGANLVGGCCGTSPEHIKAIHDLIRG